MVWLLVELLGLPVAPIRIDIDAPTGQGGGVPTGCYIVSRSSIYACSKLTLDSSRVGGVERHRFMYGQQNYWTPDSRIRKWLGAVVIYRLSGGRIATR